jgi:hypothetical protein
VADVRLAGLVGLLAVGLTGEGAAQSLVPGPPGPFVVDVRGVTQGVPTDPGLHPDVPPGATVPGRAFGLGVAGHVYVLPTGIGRLGLGGEATLARGTSPDARLTLETLSPLLTLNFGTADGWSYLGAGMGVARVRTSPGPTITVRSVVLGGGARWFPWRHVGVGFDVRLHRLAAGSGEGAALAASSLVSAGVGLSLK